MILDPFDKENISSLDLYKQEAYLFCEKGKYKIDTLNKTSKSSFIPSYSPRIISKIDNTNINEDMNIDNMDKSYSVMKGKKRKFSEIDNGSSLLYFQVKKFKYLTLKDTKDNSITEEDMDLY